MFESFWWLPDTPEQKIRGEFDAKKMELILSGHLRTCNRTKETFEVIFGEFNDKEKITLCNCVETYFTHKDLFDIINPGQIVSKMCLAKLKIKSFHMGLHSAESCLNETKNNNNLF